MKQMILILGLIPIITGCISVNKDPDILLKAPYNKIDYIENPVEAGYKTVDVIEVTTRGWQANILNTLPQLYQKILERQGSTHTAIGNIRITSFVKRVEFDIPYRECDGFPGWINQSEGLSRSVDCRTDFRTEVHDILYQKAVANILEKEGVRQQ